MTFFVDALLSPLRLGLLLALLLWLGRRRLPRPVWMAGLAIEVACCVLATPFGANGLMDFQESRAAASSACAAPAPTTIVLLAGSVRRVPVDADDYGSLNLASVQRTLDAARLALETPGAELVISGGTRPGDTVAESALMASLAQRFGVAAASIRTESDSRTTWENARFVRALTPAVPKRIWLVTSAAHMPRALIAFRSAGFDACAWPGDLRSTRWRGVGDLLPTGGAISSSEAVLHELIGEIAYRWRAWRSAVGSAIQ